MRLGKKKEDTAVGIDMKDWSSIIVRRLCYSKTAMTSIRNPKVTSRERLDTPQAVPNSSDPTPTEKKNFDDANDRRLDISTAQENVKNLKFLIFHNSTVVVLSIFAYNKKTKVTSFDTLQFSQKQMSPQQFGNNRTSKFNKFTTILTHQNNSWNQHCFDRPTKQTTPKIRQESKGQTKLVINCKQSKAVSLQQQLQK